MDFQDIVYEWEREGGPPVQRKPGVGSDLPNFLLTAIETNHECTSHTNTGISTFVQFIITGTNRSIITVLLLAYNARL